MLFGSHYTCKQSQVQKMAARKEQISKSLAQVPFEGILIEAYKGTRRKHNMKFRHIGHTTRQYGQSFFSKTISAWNGLVFAEAP